jgi:hypothetical protein
MSLFNLVVTFIKKKLSSQILSSKYTLKQLVFYKNKDRTKRTTEQLT